MPATLSAITSEDKAAVRAEVFGHLAGIVVAPVAKALAERGVFEMFDGNGRAGLDEVVEKTRGNRGYLRVALRLLASYGWLETYPGPAYGMTDEGRAALALALPLYADVVPFIPMAIFFEDFLSGRLEGSTMPVLGALVSRAEQHWGLEPYADAFIDRARRRLRQQLDGLLVGPAMVAMARAGVFEQLSRGPGEIRKLAGNPSFLQSLIDVAATQGWMEREGPRVALTACGQYAAQISAAYGVTCSYLPTFSMAGTLLFGNARVPRFNDSGVEVLVNRAMNVWGSGGAHTTYFKKVDEIIIEIFNRPIEHQPNGICDMGCGDGTLLAHLYSVVKNQTERGKVLDRHPLVIVGADFNKVARRVTAQNLRKAKIPSFHVMHGDINRPAQLGGSLEELGQDIHEFLHVRSFLDHNRPFLPPASYVPGTRAARTTGAFAHFGEEIPPDVLEENLVRHLRRWAPFVGRFGLLLLELHTLPPQLAANNLDKTPAVAYDGTHGFSDQYLVELPVFIECAREAGLVADPRYRSIFPPSELATVSINFFTIPQG